MYGQSRNKKTKTTKEKRARNFKGFGSVNPSQVELLLSTQRQKQARNFNKFNKGL